MTKFSAICILILALNVSAGIAQENPILERFDLLQVDNHVQVDFGIIGGASCFGAQLMRSNDGVNFTQVGLVPGICGGTDITEFYTVIDHAPIQGVESRYKLILGNEGESSIKSILFVALEKNHRVFPNPIYDASVIKLNNPLSRKWNCIIYDLSGKVVFELSGNNDEVYLNANDFRFGNYQFKVDFSNGASFVGRFAVSAQNP